MVIVSTRDFRSNQTRYLDLASRGESVILRSRNGSYIISPISEDDVVEKRDLANELKGALSEVKEALSGYRKMQSLDDLIDEL